MEKNNLLNLELALPSMDEKETRVLMGGTNYMEASTLPEVVVYPENIDKRDTSDPEEDDRVLDPDPDQETTPDSKADNETDNSIKTYPQSTATGCLWACMTTVLALFGYKTDENTQNRLKAMLVTGDPENMSNAAAKDAVTDYFKGAVDLGSKPSAAQLGEALADGSGLIIAAWNPDHDNDGKEDSVTEHAIVIFDVNVEEGRFSYWDPEDNESHTGNDAGNVSDIVWAIDINSVE